MNVPMIKVCIHIENVEQYLDGYEVPVAVATDPFMVDWAEMYVPANHFEYLSPQRLKGEGYDLKVVKGLIKKK